MPCPAQVCAAELRGLTSASSHEKNRTRRHKRPTGTDSLARRTKGAEAVMHGAVVVLPLGPALGYVQQRVFVACVLLQILFCLT
jgi:hypothetical protein